MFRLYVVLSDASDNDMSAFKINVSWHLITNCLLFVTAKRRQSLWCVFYLSQKTLFCSTFILFCKNMIFHSAFLWTVNVYRRRRHYAYSLSTARLYLDSSMDI